MVEIWTSVPRSGTVFIHRDPKLTFLVTGVSHADHSLRERTFFYCLRGTRDQYSITGTDHCPPRADLFRSRGPFICNVWTSVPHSRTVFNHRDPEWTFLVIHASRADHSLRERTFFYCLRDTLGQYSIKRTELCSPPADLFRSRGPFICYGWTSVPRSRTVFIHLDHEWTFLVTRASHADHFLSRALRARTFFPHISRACAARGPFASLARATAQANLFTPGDGRSPPLLAPPSATA